MNQNKNNQKQLPKQLAAKPNERDFNYIVVHSSGTMQGIPLTAQDIDLSHRVRQWAGIGYNIVVGLDGHVELGRSLKYQGAHCKAQGRNNDSIGVCYIGGTDCEFEPADTRTREQKIALDAVLQTLKAVWPEAEITGHKDWETTACPSFNARREFSHITGDTLL